MVKFIFRRQYVIIRLARIIVRTIELFYRMLLDRLFSLSSDLSRFSIINPSDFSFPSFSCDYSETKINNISLPRRLTVDFNV